MFRNLIAATFAALLLVPATSLRADDLFPDKALEAVVRQQVYAKRDNTEPLTAEDVKNVAILEGAKAGIKSLAGLEHCVSVRLVNFDSNEISDISPLAELKLLQSVNLANNQVSNLKPLAGLTSIQYLQLENNRVKNLAPLQNLTAMRSLYLSGNKITGVGKLKGMKKLWSLYLGGNPLKNAAAIGQLEFVDTLDLSHCGLESISFLKPLKRLRRVSLAGNKLSDLSVLVAMGKADERHNFSFLHLDVSDNPLSSEKAVKQLKQLSEMGVRLAEKPPKSEKSE